MNTLFLIAGALFLVYSLFIFITGKHKDSAPTKSKVTKPERKYYRARDKFFTKSEYMFFSELEKQNNGKYHIFSKVRLEDIVEVIPTTEYKTKRAKRNSIKSRHIDFVLIDKQTGGVHCAIELDGGSHHTHKQYQSDRKKDKILSECDITLHRIKVGQNFPNQIEKILI